MRRRVPGFGRWLTEGGELPYGSLAVIERWAADDYRKLQRRAWRSARVTPEDCRLAAEHWQTIRHHLLARPVLPAPRPAAPAGGQAVILRPS
jgi:hypothetical protein